jgi:hypothetical protein
MSRFLALLAITNIAHAAELKPQWLVPDQILFIDDFAQPRGEVKLDCRNQPDAPWQPNQGTRWEITYGVLRGRSSSERFQAQH